MHIGRMIVVKENMFHRIYKLDNSVDPMGTRHNGGGMSEEHLGNLVAALRTAQDRGDSGMQYLGYRL